MNRRRRTTGSRRRGAALVEFAICLPVLFVLLFGTIEVCDLLMLEETLTITAYEGGRQALQTGASESRVVSACSSVLDSRGLKNYAITVTPRDISGAAGGDLIEILVSVPVADNPLGLARLLTRGDVQAKCTIMKEY